MDVVQPIDGVTPTDGPVGTDTRRDTAAPRDVVQTGTPCASPMDITNSMRTGTTVRITANNNSAGLSGGVTPGAMCVQGMKMPSAAFQVAYRYTMQTTAVLRASTLNPGTDDDFDTIVMIQAACSATGMALACNDDAMMGTFQSTASTATPVAMGTTVFVVVAGYEPPFDPANTSQGTFELSVTEVVPIAVGGTCVAGDVCATGATCLPTTGTTGPRTCQTDGAQGTACRTAMPRCDGTLTCSATTPTGAGICRATVAAGAACDGAARQNVCETGSNCLSSMADPTMFTCQAQGAAGATCRATSPRCDTGLECSSAAATGTCRTVVAGTGACDLPGRFTVCAGTSRCVPNATFTGGMCAAEGTAGGAACRTAEPRCDAGLTCSAMTGAGTCRRAVAVGGACDVTGVATLCTASSCILTSRTAAACTALPTATMETEPNNTPMTPMGNATALATFRGAITPLTDRDCYGVTVPANGSIYAETSDGMGACPANADSIITIYNAAGTMLSTNDDGGSALCSLITPATAGASNLPAGTYSVCVTAYQGTATMPGAPIPSYTLTVAPLP